MTVFKDRYDPDDSPGFFAVCCQCGRADGVDIGLADRCDQTCGFSCDKCGQSIEVE